MRAGHSRDGGVLAVNASWVQALIAAGATAVAAFGAWLIARHRNSGSIETSDAATLWKESNAMRKEAIEGWKQCRTAAELLRVELAAALVEMAKLRQQLRNSGGAQ